MSDANRAEARLVSVGAGPLLQRILNDSILEMETLQFNHLQVAKQWQRNLYTWLRFHPELKSRISLRLDEGTATLYVIPRGKTEKRGRSKV